MVINQAVIREWMVHSFEEKVERLQLLTDSLLQAAADYQLQVCELELPKLH